MSNAVETRGFAAELRVAAGRKLEGYAAVFNVETRIGGNGPGSFKEVIAPGAFAASLADGSDVLCLCDHDATRLLARRSSGTLKLAEDTRGLAFELAVPDTQLGRDMLTLAERRDLGGMSFGFIVAAAGGDSWAGNTRTLRNVSLRECSIVQSWPAYAQTSVVARGRAAACARRQWLDLML